MSSPSESGGRPSAGAIRRSPRSISSTSAVRGSVERLGHRATQPSRRSGAPENGDEAHARGLSHGRPRARCGDPGLSVAHAHSRHASAGAAQRRRSAGTGRPRPRATGAATSAGAATAPPRLAPGSGRPKTNISMPSSGSLRQRPSRSVSAGAQPDGLGDARRERLALETISAALARPQHEQQVGAVAKCSRPARRLPARGEVLGLERSRCEHGDTRRAVGVPLRHQPYVAPCRRVVTVDHKWSSRERPRCTQPLGRGRLVEPAGTCRARGRTPDRRRGARAGARRAAASEDGARRYPPSNSDRAGPRFRCPAPAGRSRRRRPTLRASSRDRPTTRCAA